MAAEPLTAEDYASVVRAGQALHERGWRKSFSVNEMTAAWRQLVELVETGVDESADEYTNDLACRDWLAAAWPMLTERVQRERQGELDELDERFRRATAEDTTGALGRFYRIDATSGWWWRRLPAIRRGEFARELGKV